MKTIAVVGGGASALAFSAELTALLGESGNCRIVLYEKLPRVGKKILATGNGKCNVTNEEAFVSAYRGDTDFAKTALTRFPPESTVEFFHSLGVFTKTEAMGRVYPLSGQATAILDALRAAIDKPSVTVKCDTEIKSIKKQNGKFILNDAETADFVVLACGGSAGPMHGTDGSAFRLLKQLGHTVEEPKPALTALLVNGFPKALKGARCICGVRLLLRGKEALRITGEVQFTDYGLSGIPIMDISRFVSTADTKDIAVQLDTAPDLTETEIETLLASRRKQAPHMTAQTAMGGIVNKALGSAILTACKIRNDTPLAELSERAIGNICKTIKCFSHPIAGVRGFDFAQVTAGGARGAEFYPETMESRRVPQLYACGEAMNVDGGCGGFNLQWAWSSGRLAAHGIYEKISGGNHA